MKPYFWPFMLSIKNRILDPCAHARLGAPILFPSPASSPQYSENPLEQGMQF